MRRFKLFVVIVFAFLLFATVGISQARIDPVVAATIRALADYDGAWNLKDVATVSRILAHDYVYFSSTGGLADKKATLTFLSSPDYKLTFANRTDIKWLSRS